MNDTIGALALEPERMPQHRTSARAFADLRRLLKKLGTLVDGLRQADKFTALALGIAISPVPDLNREEGLRLLSGDWVAPETTSLGLETRVEDSEDEDEDSEDEDEDSEDEDEDSEDEDEDEDTEDESGERAPPSAAESIAVEQPGDWLPGEFSGSVALTSNYVYRGITLTDNDPAIQGTLEYKLQTGFLGTSVYIGTFGSNTKLVGDTDTAHVEIDALFGIRGDIGDTGLRWDLGGAFYSYPGTPRRDNFDYWEIPLRLTYKPVELVEVQLFNAYTPEYQFNTGTANYTSGLVMVEIPNGYVGWELFGGLGYQYVDKQASGTDWTCGTTVTIKGVDLTVAYTDTNYHARECGGNNQCDAKVVFTVGAGF